MRDVCWWRPPAPTDPWDSGYLRQSASALAGLNQFAPRRATLIVIDGLPSSSLADCLARLEVRQHHFAHPVRLLVLADSPYQDIRFDKALSGV